MTKTCVFHDQRTPPCPKPATHRVVKGWQQRAWCIEEALESTPVVTVDGLWNRGMQVPEFCLRHAGDVMEQRNAPAPGAVRR